MHNFSLYSVVYNIIVYIYISEKEVKNVFAQWAHFIFPLRSPLFEILA